MADEPCRAIGSAAVRVRRRDEIVDRNCLRGALDELQRLLEAGFVVRAAARAQRVDVRNRVGESRCIERAAGNNVVGADHACTGAELHDVDPHVLRTGRADLIQQVLDRILDQRQLVGLDAARGIQHQHEVGDVARFGRNVLANVVRDDCRRIVVDVDRQLPVDRVTVTIGDPVVDVEKKIFLGRSRLRVVDLVQLLDGVVAAGRVRERHAQHVDGDAVL